MKSLSYGFLATGLTLALSLGAGCSKNSASGDQAPPCATGQVCDTKLGTPADAKAYFTQLKYQTIGSCGDQTNMRFSWLTTANRVVVAKDASGNETVAEVNLYLNADDGTYTGEYQENVQAPLGSSGFWHTTAVQNKKALKGTWTINNVQLVLSDIGALDEAVVNNYLAAKLTVSGTTLNAALNGQTLLLVMNRSKISKDLQTVAQVCAAGGGH